MQRVVAAHRALQLGELAHHVGHQVGLGQVGGLVGLARQQVAAELLANRLGNRAHALDALALRAEFVVVHHLAQPRHARGQRLLAVLVKEEFRIGQTRAHHALVAADDRAGVGRRDVADHQEFVGELAGGVEQRKVFLVGLHCQNQALLRYIEKLFLELANEHIGALDQRGDFVEQRVVFDGFRTTADLGSRLGQLAHDLGAARGKAGNHGAVLLQRGGVAVGIFQHYRRHQCFKAVALGAVAGFQAQRLHRHHGAAMQCHQPVGGAHKAHAAPARHLAAGLQLVAHDLGDGQLGNRLLQRLLQAFGQRCTLDGAVVKQRLGFAVGRAFQASHRTCIGTQRLQFL